MKIDDDSRFPHPVLSRDTGDYLTGEFGVEINVEEIPFPAQVTINYIVTLTEPTLLAAIADDRAGVGLFVTCRDTYFSQLVPLGLAGGRFSFEPGSLIGRVALRPMVWARKVLTGFSLGNCHVEFDGGESILAAGAVLALDDEIIMNVGREKLAQMETIFSLVEAPDLADSMLSLQLDSERIKILAASNIYQRLNTLRGLGTGKPIVLNSVYLPAVMEVLNNMRDGANGNEGRRWHRVFTAKCQHLGIQLESPDLWQNAQKLLEIPFSEINNSREILGG